MEACVIAPPGGRVAGTRERLEREVGCDRRGGLGDEPPSASEAPTTGPGTDEPVWISIVRVPPWKPAIMSIWSTPTIRSPAAAAARA